MLAKKILVLLFVFSGSSKAFELQKPEKKHSLETLVQDMSALIVKDNKLIYLGNSSPVIMTSKVTSNKLGHLEIDEKSASQRYLLDDLDKNNDWGGLAELGNDFLLVDGFNLKSIILNEKFVKTRSSAIRWNKILPPKDRLGEAPAFEVSKMRYQFELEAKTAPGKRIRGIALKSDEQTFADFFAMTSLKSYPLVIMRCYKSADGDCEIIRNCRSEKLKELSHAHRAGMAFDSKNSRLYFANTLDNSILEATFSSCLNVAVSGKMFLPKKMKSLSSLYIQDENLVIGFTEKDDYYNSSIFVFNLVKS